MYKKVKMSLYSIIITWVCVLSMVGVMVYSYLNSMPFWWILMLGLLFAVTIVSALFYMPLGISAGDEGLTIHTPLRKKRIRYGEISSARMCPPSMAERRIVGSGGFFGYWGWFREASIGKYFAYYGKASDCFLVTLRSGRQYMLGCEDAPEMVKDIEKHNIAK